MPELSFNDVYEDISSRVDLFSEQVEDAGNRTTTKNRLRLNQLLAEVTSDNLEEIDGRVVIDRGSVVREVQTRWEEEGLGSLSERKATAAFSSVLTGAGYRLRKYNEQYNSLHIKR